MAEYSLTKLPRTASHHLDVVMRSFATKPYCEFRPNNDDPFNRSHPLKRFAYFLETSEGLKQAGPDCAASLGKQKLSTVPDFTRYTETPESEDMGHGIRKGPLMVSPLRYAGSDLEETERAKDIKYLLLRQVILPSFDTAPISNADALAELTEARLKNIETALKSQKQGDASPQLDEIRRQRETAEQADPANSLKRLSLCHIMQIGIEYAQTKWWKSKEEAALLIRCKKDLVSYHGLFEDDAHRLKRTIQRLEPSVAVVGEKDLGELTLKQKTLFTNSLSSQFGNSPSKRTVNGFDW